jgi:hypothetical protein
LQLFFYKIYCKNQTGRGGRGKPGFPTKNYKNLRGWGGRGNLGFPTIKYVLTQKPNVFFFGSNVNFIKALKRYEFFFRAEVLFTGDYIRLL